VVSSLGRLSGWQAVRRPALKAVAGVLYSTIVFEPARQQDDLGFVACTFDAEVASTAGLEGRDLVQEIQTRTRRGGVRGLHLRTDGGDGKLVRCTHGAVVDVAVDLRPWSPTYRLWMTLVLDDIDHRSVWLPAGLAHGYQALSATADVCCRVNRIHRPEHETAIRYDDPDLAIPWPLPVMFIDGRDECAPALAVVEPMLDEWFGALR
jgi:dTDP-4-dehydrorhamnose 3,5-epimerase